MHDAYYEHIYNAPDVSIDSFRLIKVERIDPHRSNLMIGETESYYSRRDEVTEIGYGPAESVSEHKGVFECDTGVESAHDRHWDAVDFHDPANTDFGYEEFKQLCQNAMRTLEAKGVSIDRHAFATTALSRYDAGHGIDHCLGEATEHAIVSAAMDSATERDERVTAD